MDIQKVRNLSDAGRFDLACECTTTEARQKYTEDAIQQATLGGIYTSHITDGRTVRLFKTLMTDSCTHDCNYCTNSTSCTKRSTKSMYRPEELAKVFMHLVRNHNIEGLFLSSGIVKDADYTTDKMIDCVRIIRNQYRFRGYIHFKALPGVSYGKLKEARQYATRMSVNIEATSAQRLDELSSIKTFKSDILRRQAWIKRMSPPSGQSTQMVIGAAGETDKEIMNIMRWEYTNMDLYRMYYSPFNPLHHTKFENRTKTPMWRAHRLYNLDWLYRKYDYEFNELKECLDDNNMLPNADPKVTHARKFLTHVVDVDTAPKSELIKVPGIGPKTASNIMRARHHRRNLRRADLYSAGAIMKRADSFIKVNGWTQRTLNAF